MRNSRRNHPTILHSFRRGNLSGREFTSPFQLGVKPRTSISPIAISCCRRNPKRLGRLGDRKPGEVSQLDQTSLEWVDLFEPLQHFVDNQNIERRFGSDDLDMFQFLPLEAAALSLTQFSTRLVDEYSPHRFGSGRKEMSAAIPSCGVLGIDESQVGLVDEGCRLQSLPRALLSQPMNRQPPKFVINQRQ